ncbi:MAG: hypothetical protein AAF039_02245 [Bacteroidota bacterium]
MAFFFLQFFFFYFVTFKLITAPRDFLSNADKKYRWSKLASSKIESIKIELKRLMTEEKLFKNQKLSANELAVYLGISRQELSEVLNVHIGMRFQDYLNEHRVEEF